MSASPSTQLEVSSVSIRRRPRGLVAAMAIVLAGGVVPATVAVAGEVVCEARNLTNPNGVSPNLQSVLSDAGGGDTIEVRGTCVGGILIPSSLTVVGKRTTALGTPTIRAIGPDQPVVIVDGTIPVTIRGIRITGASGLIAKGGGVRLDTGSLRLDSVRIDGITATVGAGGGIYAGNDTTLTLAGRTRITGMAAVDTGGGIFLDDGAAAVLRDRATIDHTSTQGWGGGIAISPGAALTMRGRSSIHHASAVSAGGAIGGDEGVSITLRDDASLHHNTTEGYGAAMNSGGTILLRDRASVHDNMVDGPGIPDSAGFGSAIEIWRYGTDPTTLTLRDSATVTGNTALTGGAAIFVWTACGLGNDPVLVGAKRTRVFGNSPKNVVRHDGLAGC